MKTVPVIKGSIPEIIRNDAGLYQGDLTSYFRVAFTQAQNCNCPYHNFRHMFHVLWLCYNACHYYQGELSQREMRSLLVAALFHDFNHSGMMGDDDLNIARSIRALKKFVVAEDSEHLEGIVAIIEATQYPYTVPSEELPLCSQIIRDADLSQAFSVAWIQQVIFGLAAEWRTKPIEVLRAQAGFLGGLSFTTEWGQQMFPPALVREKVQEAQELLNLLREDSPTTA